jgi:GNAT superfamily N-acetyltransferase
MLTPGFHTVPRGHIAAIVTVLEMHSPPLDRRDLLDPPSGLTLARIEHPSTDWYKCLFTEIGGAWLWFSRLAMPDADLAAVIADPAVDVHVLRDEDGRDVGLMELDFRTPGACELAFLGVAGCVQGRGVGRWLMQEAVARAWAVPIDRFHVHTCTFDHPAALPFYMRSGFVPVDRRVEVAPDPRLTGLLPRDAAAHVPVLA